MIILENRPFSLDLAKAAFMIESSGKCLNCTNEDTSKYVGEILASINAKDSRMETAAFL